MFKYIGSMFIANGQGTREIRSMIDLARSTFSRLQSHLWSRREISLIKTSRDKPGSGALGSALGIRDVANTSSRRKDIGFL